MRKFAAEVAKGILFLDKKRPGWRSLIDLRRLDLLSCKDCILGQGFGHYLIAIDELHLPNVADRVEYGFAVEPKSPDADYKELAEEWKKQLALSA